MIVNVAEMESESLFATNTGFVEKVAVSKVGWSVEKESLTVSDLSKKNQDLKIHVWKKKWMEQDKKLIIPVRDIQYSIIWHNC